MLSVGKKNFLLKPLQSSFSSVRIVVYSGKDHDPVECQYGSKKILLSLIGYQFDRVIPEERRRLLGIVQGNSFPLHQFPQSDFFHSSLCLQIFI
jgi:hypothetical protein